MQAQYIISSPACPSPIDYYHAVSNPYSTTHGQCFATGGDNLAGSFSRGSSFAHPHEDYQHMNDGGFPSSASNVAVDGGLSSATYRTTATMNIAFDTTDLAFNESNFVGVCDRSLSVPGRSRYSEEMPGRYEQSQGWQWEGRSIEQVTMAPLSRPHPHALAQQHPHAPTLPQIPDITSESSALPRDPAFFDLASTIKSADTVEQSHTHPVRSPTARLPTPAAMAVLLNPNGRGREQTPPPVAIDGTGLTAQRPPLVIQMPPSVANAMTMIPVPDIILREKKHACTMCHKRSVGVEWWSGCYELIVIVDLTAQVH